ncbi:hypothetical protein YPPY48_4828, partial [Yersinia pestis PY-48]
MVIAYRKRSCAPTVTPIVFSVATEIKRPR